MQPSLHTEGPAAVGCASAERGTRGASAAAGTSAASKSLHMSSTSSRRCDAGASFTGAAESDAADRCMPPPHAHSCTTAMRSSLMHSIAALPDTFCERMSLIMSRAARRRSGAARNRARRSEAALPSGRHARAESSSSSPERSSVLRPRTKASIAELSCDCVSSSQRRADCVNVTAIGSRRSTLV